MRKMNKVKVTTRQPFNHCPPGPAAILGPGSTWGRVLKIIPRDRYTMVHGQCTEVKYFYLQVKIKISLKIVSKINFEAVNSTLT